MLFKDRKDAGRILAASLLKYKKSPKTVVVGLPRGGVVVAAVVAEELGLPLDVIVPRKIGAPDNPELAIGALAGDTVYLDKGLIDHLGVSETHIKNAILREKMEAQRRFSLFRKGKGTQDWTGMTVIVVDDGIATGSTMRVSVEYLRKCKAKRIIVAVPVGPLETLSEIEKLADEVVCPFTPASFFAVGQFYESFPQTQDEEVILLLEK